MCCHGDQHPSTTSAPWKIIHHLLASSILNHWHLSPYLPWILDLFHCHCDLTLRIPGPFGSHRLRGEGSDGTTCCKELQEILFTVVMNHHVESCNCRTSVENSFPQYKIVESSSCPPSLTFKCASLRFWNSPTYALLRWIYGCSFGHSGKRPRRRVAAEATRSSRWNRVLHLSVDHWNFQPFNALKTIIQTLEGGVLEWPTLLETNFKLW